MDVNVIVWFEADKCGMQWNTHQPLGNSKLIEATEQKTKNKKNALRIR